MTEWQSTGWTEEKDARAEVRRLFGNQPDIDITVRQLRDRTWVLCCPNGLVFDRRLQIMRPHEQLWAAK